RHNLLRQRRLAGTCDVLSAQYRTTCYSKIGIRFSEHLKSGSDSRLTQAGAHNLHVGLRPNFLEAGESRGGFFLFTLAVEAQRETEKRPAILRQAREVVSIPLFGFGKAVLLHECSA